MSVSERQSILRRFLGKSLFASERADRSRCPHCGAHAGTWPTGIVDGQGPWFCTGCGGLMDERGRALHIAPGTAALSHGARALERERPTSPAREPSPLDGALVAARIAELYARYDAPRVAGYVADVWRELGNSEAVEVQLVDLGEPAIAFVPGSRLVLSLGVLAALEDEAQLAFVLAREACLDEAGWIAARFEDPCSESEPWPAWRARRRREAHATSALQLSLRVGFGQPAERAADGAAIERLRAAGYETRSARAALRALESSSLSGRGGRFLLASERAAELEARSSAVPLASLETKVNREVYRRAVGGFDVFGA